jgi:hypothetical protein
VHNDDGNVHARHNEFRWLDGTGPGAECCSGTGSRAEHMILASGNQFAVSLGQLLRELAEPAPSVPTADGDFFESARQK